jgi:NADH:ubiquinone oxidoreductase subunit 5 (subunit L)/multisubunit Na+/H+ antiporter MnhA subunit
MERLLQALLLIPLAALCITVLLPSKRERLISSITRFSLLLCFIISLTLWVYWFLSDFAAINLKEFTLYQNSNYRFDIDLYFDRVSFTFLIVGTLLTLIVTHFSRYYLHKDKGYKRYFNTLLIFYTGYAITVLSGNFETLFIGWEMLGITSFMLIGFYRERYLPVKNAIKVYSTYRIGDVGLLVAMWLSHYIWHENVTFIKLQNDLLVHEHLMFHTLTGVVIAAGIAIAAAAKSAQLPFSSWLPRAMEGPTPSSAIFYGSLSVHIGVFLLIRTFPFWEYQHSVRISIGILGLLTAIVCSSIASVQSTVKSQIAYASAAQIGLMFIEISLGFELLALLHFAGNAFLRTYQLLISPSLVSYLIREQFFHYDEYGQQGAVVISVLDRWRNTWYILSLKEFNLDNFMNRYVWGALKNAGTKASYLGRKTTVMLHALLIAVATFLLFNQKFIPAYILNYLSLMLAFSGLLLVLKSFIERQSAIAAWLLVVLNHVYIALAVSYNEQFNIQESLFYLSGVFVSGAGGLIIIYYLRARSGYFSLNQFNGFIGKHKIAALLFLLCTLALSGFPISPTFIGEDLVYSHIHQNQPMLATFISLSYIINGITLIRMYARIFLGTSYYNTGPKPYRST